MSTMGRFIYVLDSLNSSSFTFLSSKLASSSRSNWTGIWTGNSNGSWTDKHSSHFSTAKEISLKATFWIQKKKIEESNQFDDLTQNWVNESLKSYRNINSLVSSLLNLAPDFHKFVPRKQIETTFGRWWWRRRGKGNTAQ